MRMNTSDPAVHQKASERAMKRPIWVRVHALLRRRRNRAKHHGTRSKER